MIWFKTGFEIGHSEEYSLTSPAAMPAAGWVDVKGPRRQTPLERPDHCGAPSARWVWGAMRRLHTQLPRSRRRRPGGTGGKTAFGANLN